MALPVNENPSLLDSLRVQRRVLGALFLLLAVFFIGIAVTAVQGGGTTAVVIGGAAVVLAFWIGSFGLRALLVRRVR